MSSSARIASSVALVAVTLAAATARAQETSAGGVPGGYDCVSTFVATWAEPEPGFHRGRAEGDVLLRRLGDDGRRIGVRFRPEPDCEVVADVGEGGVLTFAPEQRCTVTVDVTEWVIRLVAGRGRLESPSLELELSWRTDGRRWPREKGEPDTFFVSSSSERMECTYRGPGLAW